MCLRTVIGNGILNTMRLIARKRILRVVIIFSVLLLCAVVILLRDEQDLLSRPNVERQYSDPDLKTVGTENMYIPMGKQDTTTKRVRKVQQLSTSSYLKASQRLRTSTSTSNPGRERFIIYVCDNTTYCYGLGDRQRAVASLYVMALVTNRTFGIMWTQPCPLTKFLQPNEVNWDIPAWKLQGKTSIEVEFLNPKKRFNFEIHFNQQYPQDVVYFRTNHNFIYGLKTSRFYRKRLPDWAYNKRPTSATGHALRMLMKPTDLIRKSLNEMLVNIFQDQQLDNNIMNSLKTSKICRDACGFIRKYGNNRERFLKEAQHNDTDINKSNNKDVINGEESILNCVSEINKNQSDMFPGYYYNTSRMNRPLVSSKDLGMFCKSKKIKDKVIGNKKLTVQSIRKAKGYDVVDLNLVCMHVRMGRNPTMPFERSVRNLMNSTGALWEFARPYVERGQHLYIATDSDQVRRESEAQFGLRAHSSNKQIVHIASVQDHQNETEGMALAIWEQALMMTSCQTLVQSHSGFSINAGSVREELIGNTERFKFENGKVIRIR